MLLILLVVIIAAICGYAWHVTTVRYRLVVAPDGVVTLPAPRLDADPLPVWIDTDASCGVSDRADVDDCWAIALAARSPHIAIRGISVTSGNTDAATSRQVAAGVCTRFGCDSSVDLATALGREPLVILSLGPATNIASLLTRHRELATNVRAVIAVAGGAGARYFDVGNVLFHAHDQNFRRDIPAFEKLLDAGVPLVLVPYATTTSVRITADDLQRVDPWLASVSRGWLAHWSSIAGSDGFIPFDAVATALLIAPELFRIERRTVQIRRPVSHAPEQFLVASSSYDRGWSVSYATYASPEIRERIVSALIPAGRRFP